MIEGIALGPALNGIGVVTGCLVLVYLFVSDRIVSGKRLRKAEDRAERWENVALESLGSAKVVVPVAEALHKLVIEASPPRSPEVSPSAEGTP